MTKLLPRISAYGDHALQIQYDCDGFSAAVNDAVHALAARLKPMPIWIDVNAGYNSLVVTFDSAGLTLNDAKRRLEDALIRPASSQVKTNISETRIPKTHDIPVFYGGEHGQDIDNICKTSGLSAAQLIDIHSAQSYRVCMMGFIPGFTFLSDAPKALHHPRHKTPRRHVPAGSIGIAGWQTGIYGLESPGGWQIIGKTPLKIFDKTRDNPFLIAAGDTVRFIPQ